MANNDLNEDWLRYRHWDLPYRSLEQLVRRHFGIEDLDRVAEIRARLLEFVQLPVWWPAPAELKEEVARFLYHHEGRGQRPAEQTFPCPGIHPDLRPPYHLTEAFMLDSLRGLALGDAFGQLWFAVRPLELGRQRVAERWLPSTDGPWRWTDDTAMAIDVVRELKARATLEPASLLRRFGATYQREAWRGYGDGMHELLNQLRLYPREVGKQLQLAAELYGGEGSLGNGAAMRAGPIGACYVSERDIDIDKVLYNAYTSAGTTHRHPDGMAGSVAVAVAAGLAAVSRSLSRPKLGFMFQFVAEHTPPGQVRDQLVRIASVPSWADPWEVAQEFGSGRGARADNTVPFAIWTAFHHLGDLTEALWATVAGFGDSDTTCAITGSIVAARTGLAGVDPRWLELLEPLPEDLC